MADIRDHLHDLACELTSSGWRDIAPQEWRASQRASYDRWAAEMMVSEDGRLSLTTWWTEVRAREQHGSIWPVYTIDPKTGALTSCLIRQYTGLTWRRCSLVAVHLIAP